MASLAGLSAIATVARPGYGRLGPMSLSIRQIHPVFVGEVSGVDIGRPLAPDEVAAIEAGMDRYAVLVFHDQKITDEQQMAFSRNFGALEDARGGNITKPEDKRLQAGMNDVSNLGRDGQPLPRDSRMRLFNLGNMLWHSDSSFRADPGQVLAPVGARGESDRRQHRVRRHARRATTRSTRPPRRRSRTSSASTRSCTRAARWACSTTRRRSGRCSGRCASGSCARIR